MAGLQWRIYELLLQAVRFTCKKISFQGTSAAKAPRLMRTLLSKQQLVCSFVKVIVSTVLGKNIIDVVKPEAQLCLFSPRIASPTPDQALIVHVWKCLLPITSTMGAALRLISGSTQEQVRGKVDHPTLEW